MTVTDQMHRSVTIDGSPNRIVSLVPSQSEYLWDLGLHNELIGATKFCIHPQIMYRSIAKVGGTKKLDLEKIASLKPDLIVGNKEENDKDQIEWLSQRFPVWMSDIVEVEDALLMMRQLAIITGREEQGNQIMEQSEQALANCKSVFNEPTTAYFIWNDPYMCAGGNTFIGKLMTHFGFRNVVSNNDRYPVLTVQDLKRLQPQVCLLSSEPFPFNENHRKQIQAELPNSTVILVDGEMFSWYGSRMRLLTTYIQSLVKTINKE